MGQRTLGRLTLVSSALFACCLAAGASDWPRFRGPNGTGVSDDKGIPIQWGEKDVLWKTRIPGVGNSSPVVCAGKAFLQSASADGKERMLACLDARSGKVLWVVREPGSRARTHKKNTLASSTPATDGERVYSAFWDGESVALYAHDFNGNKVWERDLGAFKSQHGAGTSPVVHDGKVVIAVDQDGASAVFCVDARTGKEIWKKPRRAFRACYSTPFLREGKDGASEVIVASTAGITAYDLANGSEAWEYRWAWDTKPLRTVASPILAGGTVFVSSGDGSGDRRLIAVKAGGKGDVTQTNLAWESDKKSEIPYVPCMLTAGDYVYSVHDGGLAVCRRIKDGKLMWSERLGSGVTASPVLIDGKIYVFGEDGAAYVYKAAPTFKLLGKSDVGEAVSASPAVADSRLYVRGRTHLYCIGKR